MAIRGAQTAQVASKVGTILDLATEELERLGVELHLKTRVTDVGLDGIVVSGPDGEERVACATKVWAAGVQASPLARMRCRSDTPDRSMRTQRADTDRTPNSRRSDRRRRRVRHIPSSACFAHSMLGGCCGYEGRRVNL